MDDTHGRTTTTTTTMSTTTTMTTVATRPAAQCEATMPDARTLRVAVTALAAIGSLAEVEFAERGVTFRVLDDRCIALAELTTPAGALRDYRKGEPSPVAAAVVVVGVDARDLRRTLTDHVADNDVVTLAVAARPALDGGPVQDTDTGPGQGTGPGDGDGGSGSDDNASMDRLCVRIASADGAMRASIPLPPRDKRPDLRASSVPTQATVVSSARRWRQAIGLLHLAATDATAAAAGNDTAGNGAAAAADDDDSDAIVQVEVTKDGVSLSLLGRDGTDRPSALATLPVDDSGTTRIRCETPVRQRLALRYLHALAPCAEVAAGDVVMLHLAADLPARVRYSLGTTGGMVMYLSPRLTTVDRD